GSGKSTELAHAISRALDLGRRIELVDLAAGPLVLAPILAGKASNVPLDLFLDTVDQRVDSSSKHAIAAQLARSPESWRLGIACRVADWSLTLESRLRGQFGDGLAVYHLLPLRREDIAMAARQAGLAEHDRFMREISGSSLWKFADLETRASIV